MARQHREPRGEVTEGVRIIGPEEAARALERDDVAKRRPQHAPRFGDRPSPPPDDAPRPAIRFPLPQSDDPSAVDRPPVAPDDDISLPHWTEPATGEVPQVFAQDDPGDEDLEAWSSFTSSQPRWREDGTMRDVEEYDDFSRFADDDTRVGALHDDQSDPEEIFSFAELDPDYEPERATPTYDYEEPVHRERRRTPLRAHAAPPYEPAPSGGAGRDVPMAIGVGVLLGVIFLAALRAGPRYALVLVTGILVLASLEFFTATRHAGHRPATLLGLAATAALALASYWRGTEAVPVILFLAMAFSLLWYLVGAGGTDRPLAGTAVTMLGIVYVGFLGSFAALLLKAEADGGHGIGILLAAVVGTVAYDVGGYVIGRSAGTRPLSEASPNKTVEGLLGGMASAIVVTTLVFGAIGGIAPFETTNLALRIGAAVALAAPLGDLCESLLKRDLGVKDMGTLLPGHGGILDRIDALLFVVPSVYYASTILLR